MAKKVKVKSTGEKVKVKKPSKTSPIINPQDLAKELGAEIIIDSKNITELKKRFHKRP